MMRLNADRHRSAALACVAVMLLSGCAASQRPGPYATLDQTDRDTRRSEQLNERAMGLVDQDPAQAERLLREALEADLFNGPAHNNLGALCLRQGRLYEAAGEFEWARKLMPGHPDPRLNLALTLERAGRTEEAFAQYDTALEVHPGHVPTMQALLRLQLRTGRGDNRTTRMLEEVALRGDSELWRDWARQRLASQP
jgi:Tfp pilus assembly protein PilF